MGVLVFDWRMDVKIPDFVEWLTGEVVCIILTEVLNSSSRSDGFKGGGGYERWGLRC